MNKKRILIAIAILLILIAIIIFLIYNYNVYTLKIQSIENGIPLERLHTTKLIILLKEGAT